MTHARSFLLAAALALATAAQAHGSRAGDIDIGHPYATPSLAGARNGAAYVAALRNTGDQADKLVRASTSVADRVELHTMAVDAQGVMRMREVDGYALAAKGTLAMRPGMGAHFMLIGLKQALKEGDSFPMTLEFERAGKVEVTVVVQAPKPRGAEAEGHMH